MDDGYKCSHCGMFVRMNEKGEELSAYGLPEEHVCPDVRAMNKLAEAVGGLTEAFQGMVTVLERFVAQVARDQHVTFGGVKDENPPRG